MFSVVTPTIERLPILEGQALKTLYIIGNGFDIAHKLPTSYWHFQECFEDKMGRSS
ncbi:AbiH family protein [uncultured Phocaeicola sp.]|uniref:AbiH family protein n=1 Tax=uncultured Phocaeicola sp. TaxID=990718 RepID=UPI00338FF8B9